MILLTQCSDLEMRKLMCVELNLLLVLVFLDVHLVECGAMKGTTRMLVHCANFPLFLSGGDCEEVQQMLMHFTVENVSDSWTGTQEQQLEIKAGSFTSVAKAFHCQLVKDER